MSSHAEQAHQPTMTQLYDKASLKARAFGGLVEFAAGTPSRIDHGLLDHFSELAAGLDSHEADKLYIEEAFKRLACETFEHINAKPVLNSAELLMVKNILSGDTYYGAALQPVEKDRLAAIDTLFERMSVFDQCDFLIEEFDDESLYYVREIIVEPGEETGLGRQSNIRQVELMLGQVFDMPAAELIAQAQEPYDGLHNEETYPTAGHAISRLLGAIVAVEPNGPYAEQALIGLAKLNSFTLVPAKDPIPTRANPQKADGADTPAPAPGQ